MPATPTQAFTNLLTALSQIAGDIINAVTGVLYAFVHLFWTLVNAVMHTGSALVVAVTDLAQNTVAFVWGNLLLVLLLGIGYYFWSSRQPSGRRGMKKSR